MFSNMRRTIRLSADLDKEIVRAATRKGFANPTVFMRAALRVAVREGQRTELEDAEQRLSASLERVAREMRSMREAQATVLAVLDSFVKIFLTCVPEPAAVLRDQAIARAKARYERFLQSTGRSLNGRTTAAGVEVKSDARD